MKKLKLSIVCIFFLACSIDAQNQSVTDKITIIKHYDIDHLHRIALPMGGIGTGTVSLGGNGALRDWEIMNVPAKGYSTVTTGNDAPFFAIYTNIMRGVVLIIMDFQGLKMPLLILAILLGL
jgi:non-lysosomal glucosylceramidase